MANMREKGNSLLKLPKDYTIIDMETTGLYPMHDDILELSALKVRDNQVIDEDTTLVIPDNFIKVSDFIADLTGITTEMILTDGKPHKDAIDEFVQFIGEDIIVGHNVNFDINFLYDNLLDMYGKSYKNDFVDTLRLSRYYAHPDLKKHTLNFLTTEFNLRSDQAHRSLSDSRTTFELYNIIFETLGESWTRPAPKKKFTDYNLKAKDILATTEQLDPFSPFFEKHIVFTGTLERFKRRNAYQLIANLGGIPQDGINKYTNYLVIGNQDYTVIKGNYSSKHKRALELKLKGQDIEIINEEVFIDMLNGN